MFTKKYNGVYVNNRIRKSVKYIGKKKRVNKITKKKKTKKGVNRVNRMIRQYGGTQTLEIVFLYRKDFDAVHNPETLEIYKTTITKSLKEFFNKPGEENVKLDNTDYEFTDDYIKYFFRLPKTEENKKNFESKEGLKDPDRETKFDGENFKGLDTNLDIGYYNYKDNIQLYKYTIEKFSQEILNSIFPNLEKNEENKNINGTYKITVIKPTYFDEGKTLLFKQEQIVIGIVKTNSIKFEPKKDIDITNFKYLESKILIKNFDEKIKTKDLSIKKNRYENTNIGYENLGATCYANSLIQLLKNIKEIKQIIEKEIQNLPQDKTTVLTAGITKTLPSVISKSDKISYCYMDDNISNSSLVSTPSTIEEFKDPKAYILFYLLKFMFLSQKNKLNTYFLPDYLKKIIDKLNTNTGQDFNNQQDSQEFLKKLELDFIKKLNNTKITFTYSFDKKEFMYYSINYKEFFNLDIVLNIIQDEYDNMQEIINNNLKGEEYNDKRNLDINSKNYAKVVSQDVYFVTSESEYILIQVKIFKGNLKDKYQLKIKNLNKNICFKELPKLFLNPINEEINSLSETEKKNFQKQVKTDDIKYNEYISINYELISIVVHTSVSSINGGHYFNYSKQINNDGKIVWVCYNDSDSSKIIENLDDINTETQIVNNTPYLFLYKRIEP